MNLELLRKRLDEIVNRLNEIKALETVTSEECDEVLTLKNESEDVKKKIEAATALESIENISNVSAGRVSAPKTPSKIEVVNKHNKTGGFKNMGDFALAIKNFTNGNIDNRFQNSTHFEFSGEDGGFLIPEDFVAAVEKKLGGDQSLLGRTRSFSTGSSHMGLPVDEQQPWNGGVQAYWMEEGGLHTSSKNKLGKANFQMHKLGAFVKVTDELLEDAGALESYLLQSAPEAINYKINDAIINGDGAGKPEGILGSSFTYDVAKEGGQAADTIVYRNIVNMESRMIPGGMPVWIANPNVRPQLKTLKDDNGNFIHVGGTSFSNAAETPFETLSGKPIIYMLGSVPTLGDRGDLMLVDLRYYYSVIRRGVTSAVSTHLYFDRDITAYKFTTRLDGKCPFKSPVQTENGAFDMSGFITLADRA